MTHTDAGNAAAIQIQSIPSIEEVLEMPGAIIIQYDLQGRRKCWKCREHFQ